METKARMEVVEEKLKEALVDIRKGCEPGRTVEEFTWGLLAGKCKVENGAFDLVIKLEPWAISHPAEYDEKTIRHRGKDCSYDIIAKRMMIEAIEHLLSVYEGRRKELLNDLRLATDLVQKKDG